jgi:hypothetical protein
MTRQMSSATAMSIDLDFQIAFKNAGAFAPLSLVFRTQRAGRWRSRFQPISAETMRARLPVEQRGALSGCKKSLLYFAITMSKLAFNHLMIG